MFGKRRPFLPRVDLVLVRLVAFALLASACLPTLVQADSSGIEYSDAPQSLPRKQDIPRSGSPANASKADGGGSAVGGESTDSSESKRGSSNDNSSSGAGKGPDAGSGGGTGQGKPGDGSAGAGDGLLQQGSQLGASGEDDSSPLVPILIAIAILAAISAGAVMVRQRRRRDDSGVPVSPKAS